MEILIPVVVFGLIGLVMGAVLAVASKVFAVESDPREEQVLECLPGANCGGCGYAGCGACAAAIVKGEAPVNACPGISADNLNKIGEIMGVKAEAKEPMAAFVKCSGTIDKVNYRYYFDGSKSCRDIAAMQNGDKLCDYACLGYGDCMNACNFGAVSLKDGIADISMEKCIGCGACAAVCPKQVIDILPKKQVYRVKCSSCDKGAKMKDICSAGCIGCKICEKNCPSGAVTVTDNVAKIDASLCTGCGICAEKCPKKVIVTA